MIGEEIPFEDIDLEAEMEKATTYKPEVPAATIEDTQDHSGDFEPEPEPEPEAETAPEENTNNINAEDLTDLIIDGSDMVLEHLMPFLYRSSLDKNDLKEMKEIARQYKKAKETKEKVLEFSERQQELMEMFIDYEDYVENVPLTKKERKNLREPLRKLLASVDFKASPGNALIAVAAMILIPRLIPMAPMAFNKIVKS